MPGLFFSSLHLRLFPRVGAGLAAVIAFYLVVAVAVDPLGELAARSDEGRIAPVVAGNAAPSPLIELSAAAAAAVSTESPAAETRPAAVAPGQGAQAVEPPVVLQAETREPLPAAPAPAVVQAAPGVASQPAPAAGTPAERWRAAGVVFVFDGQEWDEISLTNVDRALSALPSRLLATLGNPAFGPLTVLVNRHGRTLSGRQPYGQAANFFSTSEGRNELVLFPQQRPQTVLHELGHAFNLRRQPAGGYALVLLDPEMESFMAATGWRLLSSRAEVMAARDHLQVALAYDGPAVWSRLSNDDALEDFANSFALYYFNPEQLRALSVERYDWFAANLPP